MVTKTAIADYNPDSGVTVNSGLLGVVLHD